MSIDSTEIMSFPTRSSTSSALRPGSPSIFSANPMPSSTVRDLLVVLLEHANDVEVPGLIAGWSHHNCSVSSALMRKSFFVSRETFQTNSDGYILGSG